MYVCVCLSSAAVSVKALQTYRKIQSGTERICRAHEAIKQAKEIEIQINEMAFKLSTAQGPSNFK